MTRDVLAPENRELLAQFASSNALAAFDYDGTLAPIVEDPAQAWMRGRTRELLDRVAGAFPTVVISGRSQADVLERLQGAEVFAAIGNHGMEPWRCTDEDRRVVTGWAERLRSEFSLPPGVWVEDKGYSLAVHYRRSLDPEAAGREVRRAAERLEGARLVAGKFVWNLLPRAAPDKGTALETARTWLGCDSAIYVGDDETDEDVFRLNAPGRLLTVRVGWTPSSKARLFLGSQSDIDELLEALIALRHWRGPSAARDSTTGRPRRNG